MHRRAFLGTLSLLAVPLVGEAQQARKIYRVGVIATTSPVSELAGPEPVNPAVSSPWWKSLRDPSPKARVST